MRRISRRFFGAVELKTHVRMRMRICISIPGKTSRSEQGGDQILIKIQGPTLHLEFLPKVNVFPLRSWYGSAELALERKLHVGPAWILKYALLDDVSRPQEEMIWGGGPFYARMALEWPMHVTRCCFVPDADSTPVIFPVLRIPEEIGD